MMHGKYLACIPCKIGKLYRWFTDMLYCWQLVTFSILELSCCGLKTCCVQLRLSNRICYRISFYLKKLTLLASITYNSVHTIRKPVYGNGRKLWIKVSGMVRIFSSLKKAKQRSAHNNHTFVTIDHTTCIQFQTNSLSTTFLTRKNWNRITRGEWRFLELHYLSVLQTKCVRRANCPCNLR